MSWKRRQDEKRKLSGQKDWTREQKEQVKAFLKQYPGQEEIRRKAG